MRLLGTLNLGICLLALSGCDRRPAPASAQSTAPSFTPDSTRRAQLASFLEGNPPVHDLEGGAASREALVQGYLSALETRDTAALRRLALDRAEFGWIYYPTNPQARPPYDLDPGLFWFMVSQHSGKGLAKALELLGGKPLRYAGHSCDPNASREGENTVHGPCLVRLVQAAGDTAEVRLFGLVIERRGRWKFVSYANKLD